MYNKNAAYDFNLQEQTQRESKRRGEVIKLPGQKERRLQKVLMQKIFVGSAFSLFLVAAASVSVFVFGQAKLTELTDQLSKAKKELDDCKSVNGGLNMKLESIKNSDNYNSLALHDNVEIVKVHRNDVAYIK